MTEEQYITAVLDHIGEADKESILATALAASFTIVDRHYNRVLPAEERTLAAVHLLSKLFFDTVDWQEIEGIEPIEVH